MKKVIMPVVSAFALVAVAWAAGPALTGTWHVHESIMGNDADLMCTFTQTGTKLGGSCVSEQGTAAVTGTLQGSALSWTINSQYNGDPLTVTYTATINNPGKFAGTVEVDPYGVSGDFTAEPAQKAAAAPAASK